MPSRRGCAVSGENLDDQAALVASYLDPVFSFGPA